MAKRKRKKIWAIGDGRPALVLVVLLLAAYMGYAVLSAYSTGVETTAAVRITAKDSIPGNGWFFRDEITITENKNGAVKHTVFSGERVQHDAVLANVYSTVEALELSRELEPLEKQISLLDSAMQSAGDGSDAAKLDQQITIFLQQMAAQIKSGSGASLTSSVDSLRSLALKREAGNLKPEDLESEKKALSEQLKSLNQQVLGQTAKLSSPASGYFSEVVDGYESVLRPEILTDLTVAKLNALIKKKDTKAESQSLGKIIQGFSWYLAVETSEQDASRVKEGQTLNVDFTQASLEAPVTVYSISKDRDKGKAVIVLEGSVFNSEMVSMREQPVELVLGSYTGLKVPKTAVHIEEYTDGEDQKVRTVVSVLSGSLVKTKNITGGIIYEAEDYYVVRQSATDVNGLVVQDQIVIKGKDLENNMVVKT